MAVSESKMQARLGPRAWGQARRRLQIHHRGFVDQEHVYGQKRSLLAESHASAVARPQTYAGGWWRLLAGARRARRRCTTVMACPIASCRRAAAGGGHGAGSAARSDPGPAAVRGQREDLHDGGGLARAGPPEITVNAERTASCTASAAGPRRRRPTARPATSSASSTWMVRCSGIYPCRQTAFVGEVATRVQPPRRVEHQGCRIFARPSASTPTKTLAASALRHCASEGQGCDAAASASPVSWLLTAQHSTT